MNWKAWISSLLMYMAEVLLCTWYKWLLLLLLYGMGIWIYIPKHMGVLSWCHVLKICGYQVLFPSSSIHEQVPKNHLLSFPVFLFTSTLLADTISTYFYTISKYFSERSRPVGLCQLPTVSPWPDTQLSGSTKKHKNDRWNVESITYTVCI